MLGFLKKNGKNCSSGFSLIEVSILLMILGILMVPFIRLLDLEMQDKIWSETSENPMVVRNALRKFALAYGRYPVPARRSASPGDADYGREFPIGSVATCSSTDTTVCRTTAGSRDAVAPTGADPVLIGTVPFAALGLPYQFSVDGYGRKLTYAVTESQTDGTCPATSFDTCGAIKLVSKSGADHTNTGSNLHYAIVSHGPDGKGGFTLGGTMHDSCAGPGLDVKNCDNDAVFNSNFEMLPVINAAGVTQYVFSRSQYLAEGVGYYDDYIEYAVMTTGDIWTRVAASPDMFNRNAGGHIRIGRPSGALLPAIPGVPGSSSSNQGALVEVWGNVAARTLEVNRLCALADCDASRCTLTHCPVSTPVCTPSNCASPGGMVGAIPSGGVFAPAIFGGVPNLADVPGPTNNTRSGGGILCGANRGMSGIASSDERCDFNHIPNISALVSDFTSCPGGQLPRGTDATGRITCAP